MIPIKQQDINNAVWNACDTFRGVMDAASYKDYILVILFLKYISDVWKDKNKQYQREYGGNVGRIDRRLGREPFVLPPGADFYTLYQNRHQSDIGEQINKTLEAIETATDNNKYNLNGVFRNIDFNSEVHLGTTNERNRRLKSLLEDFNKPALDLRPSRVSQDIIGDAYIYLIERFATGAGKKAGEFYTPHKVSQLVAKLCAPTPRARICDPACGAGGLLLEAAKAAGGKDYALYGMEINGGTWALCRMNMFLHKQNAAHIERCNTLTEPALIENDGLMKFTHIVANPPFSLDKWGAQEAESDRYQRFWRGIPPRSKGDYAFISHMLEAAQPRKGRVAVVVPHGVLFRGAAEGRIRQQLLQDNLLDAVVGLPANLFPTTSIPVAILVFDRSREKGGVNEKRKDVLFIDASQDYQTGKNQNTLLDEHINKILHAYQQRQSVEKYAHRASVKEIAENDHNLNIPRYVDTYTEEAEIDIGAVQAEIDQLEKELGKVKAEMAEMLKGIKR